MIYTITMNPSIDHMIWVDELQTGGLHRTRKETLTVGGKGLNVSKVLKQLDIPTKVWGFVGGFTGNEVKRQLQQLGIQEELILVAEGITRINVKVFDQQGVETQVNGQGPQIGAKEIQNLWEQIQSLKSEDWVILSGSVPSTIPNHLHLYEEIAKGLSERNIPFVVDAEGELMINTLPCGPFLVKPNLEELKQISNKPIQRKEDILLAARHLQNLGARNVLVSLGPDGALLLTSQGDILRRKAPSGRVISTIGAGDSMVGGFLGGLLSYHEANSDKEKRRDGNIETMPLEQYRMAFDWGIACGSACAFSEELPNKGKIQEMLQVIASGE